MRKMSTPNTVSSERQLARNSARELVDEITRDLGFLSKSTYAKMDSETQRKVEEAMLMKDKLIGSSTITYDDPIIVIWYACEAKILILQIGKKSIQ